jgi:DNA-binding transcriptional ArsR family regulator
MKRGVDMGFHESFKALSDRTRREILNLLKKGDMTAGDIAASFSMTQATVSHHLSVLKDAGLVSDRREGKYILYELNTSVIEEMMAWFIELKGVDSGEK